MEQELKSLLRIILLVGKDYPELNNFMLDKLCFLVEHVANACEMIVGTSQPTSKFHSIVEAGSDKKDFVKVNALSPQIFVACLEGLDVAGAVTSLVLFKLKHLVSLVCHCSLFNCYMHTLYALLLHSLGNWDCLSSERNKTQNVDQNVSGSFWDLLEDVALNNECARNMLSRYAKWCAYSAGKHAARMGACSKDSGYCLHVVVLHNLVGWLRHTGLEICLRLISLLKADGVHEASFCSQPRFQISNIGCESGNILAACRSAVKGIIDLQNDCIGMHGEDLLSRIFKNGTQLLLNVTKEWMSIPFQTLKYFFKVRPAVGALLFSSIAGLKNSNELVVLPGSHPSLNLCLQLENVPADLASRLKKIYCILYCKTSFSMRRLHGDRTKGVLMDHETWTTDTMIYLHERLQWYITELSGKSMKCGNNNMMGRSLRHGYALINGTTQRFSTCLLNVSAFPVSSYRIQWLSCCIDTQAWYRSFLPLNSSLVFTVEKPLLDQ
ncbi:hypothetical protein Ancab_028070 [Ancistrocladus abbreviatus]